MVEIKVWARWDFFLETLGVNLLLSILKTLSELSSWQVVRTGVLVYMMATRQRLIFQDAAWILLMFLIFYVLFPLSPFLLRIPPNFFLCLTLFATLGLLDNWSWSLCFIVHYLIYICTKSPVHRPQGLGSRHVCLWRMSSKDKDTFRWN